MIHATGDDDASYSIGSISLEFDVVTQPELARMIRNQYTGRLAILYDRVLRHRRISKDKSDTLWNINLNVPARPHYEGHPYVVWGPHWRLWSWYWGLLQPQDQVTIEEIPNQLYSQGMRAYQQWDEERKFLAAAPGSKRHPEVATVAKDLALADVSLADFLTNKYALWLDLRTSDDDRLHGSGRRIENASEGVTIQITKMAEALWTHSSTSKIATSSQPFNNLPRRLRGT